ncbi:hypothetical protein CsSME_00041817 [Camellia sinensis var. sinensis]
MVGTVSFHCIEVAPSSRDVTMWSPKSGWIFIRKNYKKKSYERFDFIVVLNESVWWIQEIRAEISSELGFIECCFAEETNLCWATCTAVKGVNYWMSRKLRAFCVQLIGVSQTELIHVL